MNTDEVKQVVAKIQLGDNRQVDALTIREWQDTIGHLGFTETIEAVTMHRKESTAYLMPAHVIANVRRVRESAPRELLPMVNTAPKPENFEAMTESYRSGDAHRIAVELGKYNRQIVDAGRPRIPEWPLAEKENAA